MNEDRLRSDLAGLAAQVDPVDLRDRTLRTSRRLGIQRAVATSAAVLVVIAAATGTALAIRPQGQGVAPQPAEPTVVVTTPPVEVTPSLSPSPAQPLSRSPSVSPSAVATESRTATASASRTADQSTSTSPSTSVSASPSARPSVGSRLVFDPDGLGELKLGMTKKQALATGMIKSFQEKPAGSSCPSIAELKGTGGSVWWSTKLGVVVISPASGVETVQGLHVGSSRDDVVRVYPEWAVSGDDNGRLNVAVPGNPDARFRIEMANQKVTSIALQDAKQDCYE